MISPGHKHWASNLFYDLLKSILSEILHVYLMEETSALFPLNLVCYPLLLILDLLSLLHLDLFRSFHIGHHMLLHIDTLDRFL